MGQVDLFNNEVVGYVKSPLNYIGGKYKYLDLLLPLFPSGVNVFVDVFGGGFNVGVNVDSRCVWYNDMLSPVVELMEYFNNNRVEYILEYIDNRISEYGLSKTDKSSFNCFRDEYNQSLNKHPLDLFILGCYSFNHQLRWNNQQEYNSSHGTNRSSYNQRLQKNLTQFIKKLQTKKTVYYNKDYRKLPYNKLTPKDFCYFDPPYIITTGNYNDGNRGFKTWTTQDEKDLYNLLDHLTEQNIHWGLTNTTTHDGKQNTILQEWMKKYTVYELNTNYSNSNYHKKTRHSKNTEVYITNIFNSDGKQIKNECKINT